MVQNLLIAGLFTIVLVLAWQLLKASQTHRDEASNMAQLNKNIDEMRMGFIEQMNLFNQQINERLKEHGQTGKRLEDRLDTTSKSYVEVSEKLARLGEANKRIYDIGKDIASLQEILSSPKLRGNLGELFLGDLLAQFFPPDKYVMQHTFSSGETVDAVLKLRDDNLVPIDSKFPLENFIKMLAEEDPTQRNKHRSVFLKDVKKHIDAIASKYILPNEGTLDFALMYVPAENVYYEMIVNDDTKEGISTYAMEKKVIPVSPNNFYVYLQTIMLGLRGMQIEKNAKVIHANLKGLQKGLKRFSDDFSTLGSHLGNAKNKYDESEKKLLNFNDSLENIDKSQVNSTELIEN